MTKCILSYLLHLLLDMNQKGVNITVKTYFLPIYHMFISISFLARITIWLRVWMVCSSITQSEKMICEFFDAIICIFLILSYFLILAKNPEFLDFGEKMKCDPLSISFIRRNENLRIQICSFVIIFSSPVPYFWIHNFFHQLSFFIPTPSLCSGFFLPLYYGFFLYLHNFLSGLFPFPLLLFPFLTKQKGSKLKLLKLKKAFLHFFSFPLFWKNIHLSFNSFLLSLSLSEYHSRDREWRKKKERGRGREGVFPSIPAIANYKDWCPQISAR